MARNQWYSKNEQNLWGQVNSALQNVFGLSQGETGTIEKNIQGLRGELKGNGTSVSDYLSGFLGDINGHNAEGIGSRSGVFSGTSWEHSSDIGAHAGSIFKDLDTRSSIGKQISLTSHYRDIAAKYADTGSAEHRLFTQDSINKVIGAAIGKESTPESIKKSLGFLDQLEEGNLRGLMGAGQAGLELSKNAKFSDPFYEGMYKLGKVRGQIADSPMATMLGREEDAAESAFGMMNRSQRSGTLGDKTGYDATIDSYVQDTTGGRLRYDPESGNAVVSKSASERMTAASSRAADMQAAQTTQSGKAAQASEAAKTSQAAVDAGATGSDIEQQKKANAEFEAEQAEKKAAAKQAIHQRAAERHSNRSADDIKAIKDKWAYNRRERSVMGRRRAEVVDRERYEKGDYSTEHDADFAKRIQEGRKAWAAKHGGDASGYDKLIRKHPESILDKSKGEGGLVGDAKDFLGRRRHAHMNVAQARTKAREGLSHIKAAMDGGTFASLRTGEGGKGFLSKGETEHIIQQTSGKDTRLARAKDRVGGFINRHSYGLTNLRTNRVEEMRNTMAMEKMKDKEKAIKQQIRGYNSLDKRIKNYDPAAMNAAHSRKGAVKEAQRSVAKQRAAAAKKAGKFKLGWKGKAGAVAALLGAGAILGNMMGNHGEQSNAQLYNPNPQAQYAN